MIATMFVLRIWFCYPGLECDEYDPKNVVGYFTDQTECNVQGFRRTRREKFMIWNCPPEDDRK